MDLKAINLCAWGISRILSRLSSDYDYRRDQELIEHYTKFQFIVWEGRRFFWRLELDQEFNAEGTVAVQDIFHGNLDFSEDLAIDELLTGFFQIGKNHRCYPMVHMKWTKAHGLLASRILWFWLIGHGKWLCRAHRKCCSRWNNIDV